MSSKSAFFLCLLLDVSDGGASDVRDDDDLFRRNVKIRHRRAAAEKKPPRHSSPPKSDVQMPDSERIASDGKGAAAVVQDSYKGSERDDADGDSMDTEVRGNDGCSKEPGFIDDEGYEDEDEVSSKFVQAKEKLKSDFR